MNTIAPPAYENIGEMVEEIRHLRERLKEASAEAERLQAVVDAARKDVYMEHGNKERVQCMCAVCIAIRTLDGSASERGAKLPIGPRNHSASVTESGTLEKPCPTCYGRGTVVRVGVVRGESVDVDVDCPQCGLREGE